MIKRVAVLGSSISMLVRPIDRLPYPRTLERLLNEADDDDVWIVDNYSTIAATVEDLPSYLPRLIADRPEAVIVHYGHVEPIFRPHNRSEWYRTFGVNFGDSPLRRRARAARRSLARSRQRLRLLEQWTPMERFEALLRDGLTYLRKETVSKLILIEANPGGPKIESWGPGSTAAIAGCNEVMRRVAADMGASWLDLESALGAPLSEAIPDGTHFSAEAHDALALAIQAALTAAPSAR